MKWWAITGRVDGDDEDTGAVYQADTQAEAEEMFRHDMRDANDLTDADLQQMEHAAGRSIYISNVFESDTEISIVHKGP